MNFGAANAQVADFELSSRQDRPQLAATVAPRSRPGRASITTRAARTAHPRTAAGAYNASAEDTSSSKALVLNIINPSASASCETVLKGALVEIA
jgi:hypothetical protein